MSTTLAPFGLRPAYNPSGTIRPRAYTLAAGQASYGTALYKGAPVSLATDGTMIIAAGTTNAWLGVLEGFEYIDAYGKPTKAPFLPATPAGITNVVAYVIDDPDTVFEVQCGTTAVAITAVGAQLTAPDGTYGFASGNTATGNSTFAFSGAVVAAGAQGMVTVLGLAPRVDNEWGDAYTILHVQNSNPLFRAAKVAI